MNIKKVIYNKDIVHDNSLVLRISLIGIDSKYKKESFSFSFTLLNLNRIDVDYDDYINIWTQLDKGYIYLSKEDNDSGLKLRGGISVRESGRGKVILNSDTLVSQNADFGPMLLGLRNNHFYYSKVSDCDVIESKGVSMLRFKLRSKHQPSKKNRYLTEQLKLV
ncbi:hypothetical protein [Photobacterium leiognathi]|uniref:hypothetical protein n=1 Tax=Photobacterium leiognathi TaxID=553611 RepID=UPI00298144C2|nr:hypothetical protein [Photobacterium leiognathi]